jgi:hypothetical protein
MSQPKRLPKSDVVAAGLLVATVLAGAPGCDSLACGPGTHRERDRCVPNVQVLCGEGTVYLDGACVRPDEAGGGGGGGGAPGTLTCGPGTREVDGVCLPDGSGGSGPGGTIEPAGGSGGGPSPGGDPGGSGGDPGGSGGAVVLPDAGPPAPRCPEGREPGTIPAACDIPAGQNFCVVGIALDLLTGCAVEEGTGVLLTDPLAVAAGTPLADATRGRTRTGPNGVFTVIGNGMAGSVGITLDDEATLTDPTPGAGTLMRSSSGVQSTQAVFGETYRTIAFSTTQAQHAVWNDALGRPANFLETNGFMIGRVFSYGPEGALLPVDAARPVFTINSTMASCAEGGHCLRFLGDSLALDDFQAVGATTTGASGVFLVIRGGNEAFRDQVRVAVPEGYPARGTTCGAAPGSGFHLPLLPIPTRGVSR